MLRTQALGASEHLSPHGPTEYFRGAPYSQPCPLGPIQNEPKTLSEVFLLKCEEGSLCTRHGGQDQQADSPVAGVGLRVALL